MVIFMQNENLKNTKKTKPKPESKHLLSKLAESVSVKSAIAKPAVVNPAVVNPVAKPILVNQPILTVDKPIVPKPVIVKPVEVKPIVVNPVVTKPVAGVVKKPVIVAAKPNVAPVVVKPVPVAQKIKPKVKVISETIIKPKTVASQSVEKKEKKPGRKILIITSKRKTAIARAYVRPGKGRIVVNKKPYQLMENKFMLDIFREPLVLIEDYNKELLHKLDVEIFVHGGGTQGQLVACRNCVAKAFVQYFKDPVLEKKIMSYNRGLLVDDARRVESKKPLGTKARAKKQHSKR